MNENTNQDPKVQKKQGIGCVAAGGIGCLVMSILLIVSVVILFTNTPKGKEFLKSFKSATKVTENAAVCSQQLTTVYEAIGRYHQVSGTYPDSLAALHPDYLPDMKTYHCEIDPTPSHTTFVYTKPTAKSPASSELLSFSWSISLAPQQSINYEYYYTINGDLWSVVIPIQNGVAGAPIRKLISSDK